MGEMNEPHPTDGLKVDPRSVLLKTDIADWRTREYDTELLEKELTPEQRQQRIVTIGHDSYSGLWIAVEMPDGSRRAVSLEIDMGNLTVSVYRDEMPDVKVTPLVNGCHVKMLQMADGAQDVFVDHDRIVRGAPEVPAWPGTYHERPLDSPEGPKAGNGAASEPSPV